MTARSVFCDFGTGRYTPSEPSLLVGPRHDARPPGERRAIIVCPGHGAGPQVWLPGTAIGDHMRAWALAGHYALSPNGGGTETWGNDPCVEAMLGAYQWTQDQGMAPEVDVAGWSMGGGEGLQFMKEHPTLVRRVLLFAPNTNTHWFHENGTPEQEAEIDAAYAPPNYPSGDYSTNSVGHRLAGDGDFSPWQTDTPIRIYHSTDDPVAPFALSEAFVAGVDQANVDLAELGAGDHYPFDEIDPADTVAFFAEAA